jgi:hypothetical protein
MGIKILNKNGNKFNGCISNSPCAKERQMQYTQLIENDSFENGVYIIFASKKVPQRFNVERSIALGNTTVAAHRFRSWLPK